MKLTEFDYPQIYCDMDGVLVDLIAGATKILGYDFSKRYGYVSGKHELWDKLAEEKMFWAELPPMPDMKQLWGFISTFQPNILTAVPAVRLVWDPPAGIQKAMWCEKNLGISRDRVYAVQRRDKKLFAKSSDGRPNVLIDDHQNNIQEFKSAGGIAVHHTSASDTIAQLEKIGF
mgnify:FL=1